MFSPACIFFWFLQENPVFCWFLKSRLRGSIFMPLHRLQRMPKYSVVQAHTHTHTVRIPHLGDKDPWYVHFSQLSPQRQSWLQRFPWWCKSGRILVAFLAVLFLGIPWSRSPNSWSLRPFPDYYALWLLDWSWLTTPTRFSKGTLG